MKWCEREEWREPFRAMMALHLGEPCATAGIAIEDLPDLVGDDGLGALWGCVFEDLLTREFEDSRNIVDDYIKRRGWNESVPNKRYMTALRSSAMSLYEVSNIVRDEGFLARDLLRGGEPVRVSEKSATLSLKPWDRIAARILKIGPAFEMSGGALPFTHDLGETVLSRIRHTAKTARVKLDTDTLRTAASVFTSLWLSDVIDRMLHSRLPSLCNSDGDDIVWTNAHYRLTPTATAEAIKLALAAIPSLRPEGDTFWNWVDLKRHTGKHPPKGTQAFITTLDDSAVVLGTLELSGRTLALEVNSTQRCKRGRALIESALVGLVGRAIIESKTVDDMMASRSANNLEATSSRLPPEAEHSVLHAALEHHYRGVLDETVPMLGNKTPRQAAKTAKGRQALVAWLKFLENGTASEAEGTPGYDFGWMWDELGIGGLRR